MVYIILFFTAFLSATLLPLGSEALLLYDITQGYNLYILLAIATLGNSLGSILNYYIGLKGEEYLVQKKYLKEQRVLKTKKYFDRYGGFAILLSWVPIIGDPITLIAGVLKYDIKKFIALVTIAKFSRYAVLVLFI